MIQIPVTNDPNQSFNVNIPLTGRNIVLGFFIKWNSIAEYWEMTISDPTTGDNVISNIPMLMSEYPAHNLLEMWSYLDIGSAYVLPLHDNVGNSPGVDGWDKDFVLLWE